MQVGHEQQDRALPTRPVAALVAVTVLVAYCVGAAAGRWEWGVAAFLGIGFFLFVVDRKLGIRLVPSAILTGRPAAEARRYHGPPGELSPELLAGLQVSRRSKLTPVAALGVCVGVAVAAVAPLGLLVLLVLGWFTVELRGAQASHRLRGHELRLSGERLAETSPSGDLLGSIDLRRPFTYEYLYKDDVAAVFRLRQGADVVDFTSASEAAPWVTRDLLGLEWPPANLGVRDF